MALHFGIVALTAGGATLVAMRTVDVLADIEWVRRPEWQHPIDDIVHLKSFDYVDR